MIFIFTAAIPPISIFAATFQLQDYRISDQIYYCVRSNRATVQVIIHILSTILGCLQGSHQGKSRQGKARQAGPLLALVM
jgi:hypothetical protein